MKRRRSVHSFFKFGLVGALATLTHYAVMFSGIMVWHSPVFWSFVGATIGAVVGYSLNYVYTFESQLPHRRTTWRYGAITVLSILLNTAVFYAFFWIVGISVLVAQIISTVLSFIFNYFMHKNMTFGRGLSKPL